MASRGLRSARLRQAHGLCVPQGQGCLRAIPDRSAHQPKHRNLAADLALESDGLAGDPREPSGGAHRKLTSICVAAVSPRGVGPVAGTQGVIAAYGDRVVMEAPLPAALAALFRESTPAAMPARVGPPTAGHADDRAR